MWHVLLSIPGNVLKTCARTTAAATRMSSQSRQYAESERSVSIFAFTSTPSGGLPTLRTKAYICSILRRFRRCLRRHAVPAGLILIPSASLASQVTTRGARSFRACSPHIEKALAMYGHLLCVGIIGGGFSMTLTAGVGSRYRINVLMYMLVSLIGHLFTFSAFMQQECAQRWWSRRLAIWFLFLWAIQRLSFQSLIAKSVSTLEGTLAENLRSLVIHRIYQCQGVVALAALALSLHEVISTEAVANSMHQSASELCLFMSCGCDFAASALATIAYWKQCRFASQAREDLEIQGLASDFPLAAQATRLTRQHCRVMFYSALASIATICLAAGSRGHDVWALMFWLLFEGDTVIKCFAALTLSGVVDRNRIASEAQVAEEEKRARRQEVVARHFCKFGSGDPGWWSKVAELSQRGITMEALLRFYRGLGTEYMTNFNPDMHTTRDVVRAAIIPLSAEGECALAHLIMGGKAVHPNNMVTHNWGNLFKFLVAGIVADALGSPEFGIIADFLSWDFDTLFSMLRERGKLQETYWICAFSISQHDSICGSNPDHDVDPVSGVEHQICSCTKRKHFNTDGTLDSKGRSIECELNKFDDVMIFLAAGNPRFSQIVCVDGKFDLFTRAWCIAEIAEAFSLGMRQQLQVLAGRQVTSHEPMLRALRVEGMQASRREDVERILAKIPDKALFNSKLQEMMFGSRGLLSLWATLDGEQRLSRISWWLLWLRARQGRRSCWIEVNPETTQSPVSARSPERQVAL